MVAECSHAVSASRRQPHRVNKANTLKSAEPSSFFIYSQTLDLKLKSDLFCLEDVPLVEFMYLVFTRMPGELPQATRVFVAVLV